MTRGTKRAGEAGVRAARLATMSLAAMIVATGPVAAGPPARGSRWFTDPAPPMHPMPVSRFFTDPAPAMQPMPVSRFFTDPVPTMQTSPTSRWFAGGSRGGARVEPTAYDPLIREIAARYGVEYALVKAMIQAESAFNRLAVSPKGACGLMQLMPATARSQGVRDVFHPRENIEGGCRYLRWLLDRYAGRLSHAVAAYNAGPDRVDAAGGVPRIAETQEYLYRVLTYRVGYLREK